MRGAACPPRRNVNGGLWQGAIGLADKAGESRGQILRRQYFKA